METLEPHRLYTPAEVSAITGLSKSFIKEYARADHPHARGGRRAILFGAKHIRLLLQHVSSGEPLPPAAEASPGNRDADPPADAPIDSPGVADWWSLRSCPAEPR